MNWYKIAKDFKERNIINAKIKYLEEIKETLTDISKIIFQSGKTAKDINIIIVGSKKITSYPKIRDILIDADHIALDSPWKFSGLCHQAIDKINQLVGKLKKERDDFTFQDSKRPRKGWV
ncbi:hypothetical protein LCGC14_2616060 [marine sediment metagenome]|uniref:Uncharacterized protein n=1 Tax=marine sediment metagenome TaxID=412755 RepID=A0A0F9CX44_9ZZZZ